MKLFLLCILTAATLHAQSDLDKIIKGGEIIMGGLVILKNNSTHEFNEKGNIDKVCIKNKLKDKVSFTLTRKNEDGTTTVKEAVIPKEGKECLMDLPRGIYAYEIDWPDKQVYKKGEYKFDGAITITLKDP